MPSQEFLNFISYSNFQLAWERLQHSIRYEVKDHIALDVYGAQKDIQLESLIEQITSQQYAPSHAADFYVPKRNGDKRRFAFLDIDDRLVYQALGNLIIYNSYNDIINLVERKSIFANIPTAPDKNGNWSNYVFRRVFSHFPSWSNAVVPGQYDLFVQEVLTTIDEVTQNYTEPYLIRTDIAKYFHTIPHDELIKRLEFNGWLNDAYLQDLFKHCLSSWSENKESNQGIPVGYETSDYLSNLYLTSLDSAKIDSVKMIRYVDDIYIFVEGHAQVQKVLEQLDHELNDLSLNRNLEKTKSYNLRLTPKNLIENEIRINLSTLRDHKPRSKRNKSLYRTKNYIKKQKALQDTFEKFYSIDDISQKELCDPKNLPFPSVIAFILYRLDSRNEQLKKLALCMLQFFLIFLNKLLHI